MHLNSLNVNSKIWRRALNELKIFIRMMLSQSLLMHFRTGRGNNSNCLLSSVLLIWGYNYTVISSLDQSTIIQDINDKTKTR